MKKRSVKNTRINEEVLRELSDIIRGGLKDPRIAPITSILAVDTAPDLKTAKIYVSTLGDDEAAKSTLEGLESSSGYIRNQLARRLNLRNTPQLIFKMDQSIKYGIEMSKMIDDIVGQEGNDD